MNKNIYLLGIYFLTISAAAGIFQSALLLKQGFSMIFLQSYASWFLVYNLVYLIATIFVLRYFYFKQWRFVFISGLIAIILSVIQFIFQYVILIAVARHLAVYNSIVVFINILAGTVFAAALVSSAGSNKLLKLLGAFTIIYSVTLITGLLTNTFGLPHDLANKALIWLTVLSSVFPFFYILVFLRDMKQVTYESGPSVEQESFHYAFAFAGVIFTIVLLTLGSHLGTESYWHLDWERRAQDEARKLAEPFDARVYVNDHGDTLNYLLMKPLNYDTTQKYPLVTCLHGGPTRIAGNIEVTQPAPLLSEPRNREKHSAFIFVPQGRPGVLWGGIPQAPSMDTLVFEAMHALEQEFRIDDKRRYVAGISGGGYGTWHFICSHPDMFAAAIPMCGAGNRELAKRIIHVPVWAFHGEADRNVPVSGSRDMIEAMKKAGGNPKYNEFPGVGHHVWPEVEKTEGVLEWLFAQKRQ